MSQKMTDAENFLVGSTAAFLEGIALQPTLYWKNTRAQNLPLTINPRIIYRGTSAAILNEMQMMGVQFGLTGFFQRMVSEGDTLSTQQELAMAALGGVVSAVTTSPVELIMIQQQRFGGNLFDSTGRVFRRFGLVSGLFRGLFPCFGRDAVYVLGLLGVTPVAQRYMMKEHQLSQSKASLYASFVGGIFAAVPSHPLDVVKTCLQGDMEQTRFQRPSQALKVLWREGGMKRLYMGVTWRTINITATVYIANECQNFYNRNFLGKENFWL